MSKILFIDLVRHIVEDDRRASAVLLNQESRRQRITVKTRDIQRFVRIELAAKMQTVKSLKACSRQNRNQIQEGISRKYVQKIERLVLLKD